MATLMVFGSGSVPGPPCFFLVLPDSQVRRAAMLHVELEAHPIFFAAEQIFCTYFFLELLIRYLAFRRTIDCFTDPWFAFDSA